MKSLLICPVHETTIPGVAGNAPAVMAPLMGRSPVEYWLAELAAAGNKEVTVMAQDHPELRAVVGDGRRWGLKTSFVPYPDDRNAAEDFRDIATKISPGAEWTTVAMLEHLPGMPQLALFESYAGWFSAALAWMPQAKTPERVGVREVESGVWVCKDARISASAELVGPCWIGRNAVIGARAVIGPRAIIEDEARVEPDAEVTWSQIGPATLVGRYSGVHRSLAFGNRLTNWETGSETIVADKFLLCALKDPMPAGKIANWWQRLMGTESRA